MKRAIILPIVLLIAAVVVVLLVLGHKQYAFQDIEADSVLLQIVRNNKTEYAKTFCQQDKEFDEVMDMLHQAEVRLKSLYIHSYEIGDTVYRLYFFNEQGETTETVVISGDNIYSHHIVFGETQQDTLAAKLQLLAVSGE